MTEVIMNQVFDFFFQHYQSRALHFIILEAIAFFFGIASVLYAQRENVLVYPTGLVATTITVYLFYQDKLLGDMMLNFYYSIMSIFGWWNWTRKKDDKLLVPISRTNTKEKLVGGLMFIITLIVTYAVYKSTNTPINTSNYIDILTSGIFFTGMWFMANKKIENWTLWIIGDVITVPLYASRGWGMFALQYLIFTILAIQGYRAWRRRLNKSLVTA